jgi:shikimate dehydrogenase
VRAGGGEITILKSVSRKLYFLGVTTAHSSIHRIFPRWAALAGVDDAVLASIDIGVDAEPEYYRRAVQTILDDPKASGGLVTTHKVNIYRCAGDLFTEFDEDARHLGEVNCIVRRPGRLAGLATDTLTAGLALREILAGEVFAGTALILGAGGAAVALATSIYRHHTPRQVMLTDISPARLDGVRGLVPARCSRVHGTADHDRMISELPAGSLIVNATGMGKDRPGSPITPAARFPRQAIAWDFNYRGDLMFLDVAREQGVRIVNGWNYFLHGWSQVMARVYGFELTPELFAQFREAALQ